MHARRHVAVAGLALLLGAAGVQAQTVALDAEHPRGAYAGVKPGGDAPPGTTAKPGERPTEITWPGFQMQPDGSSRVFVQATAPLTTQGSVVGNTIEVDLGDVKVERNNRHPLYTEYFNTPVTKVEIRQAQGRTVLVLTLRAQVKPRISTEQAASGFFFLYLDFPPGEYRAKPAAPVAGAKPAPPSPAPAAPPAPAEQPAPQVLSALPEDSPTVNAGLAVDAELPKAKGTAKAKAKSSAGGSMSIGH